MNTKYPLLLAVVLVLAGCASQPISNEQAKMVPKNKIHDTRFLAKSQGSGEVVVKRDDGFTGGGCTARIFLNGKPLADLDVAEKVVINLPPGDYFLGGQGVGMCRDQMSEVKTTVVAGGRQSFRFGYSMHGASSLQATAF